MSIVATISVTPIGWRTEGLGEYVAEIVSNIREETLKQGGVWETTAMNTTIEVDTLEQILGVFRSALSHANSCGVKRVLVSIQMDILYDGQKNRISQKRASVYRALSSPK